MPEHATRQDGARPIDVTILLLDGFTQMAFAGAVEPLRLANFFAGRTLYSWTPVSLGGGNVESSSGILHGVRGGIAGDPPSTLIVVGGHHGLQTRDRRLLAYLRRTARGNGRILAVCTASEALGHAGLLDRASAAVHWEFAESFRERFPSTEVRDAGFVAGRIATSAGATAVIDLMLHEIAARFGTALATRVGLSLLHHPARGENDRQRPSVMAEFGVPHVALSQTIRLMRESIEQPLSLAEISRAVGLSQRQIERLFCKFVGKKPKSFYLEIRLERARQLLSRTDLSTLEIAMACGFSCSSHFARCFRAQFGQTPAASRGGAAAGAAGAVRESRADTLVITYRY
jgi:transcriptional regulator GlxA family with amidase domain